MGQTAKLIFYLPNMFNDWSRMKWFNISCTYFLSQVESSRKIWIVSQHEKIKLFGTRNVVSIISPVARGYPINFASVRSMDI